MNTAWLLAVLGAGLGSYALRVAPFLWRPLFELGRRYADFLTYMSFAIAAGIVAKSLLLQAGHFNLNTDIGLRVAAVLVGLGVYRWLHNTPLALFAGVLAAIMARWLLAG